MATPWKYCNLQLPTKLPPPPAPIPVSGLPIAGYLEQTLANALSQAVLTVGQVRPKHPFRSLPQSASEYLGLYLKGLNLKIINLAFNPQTKEWVRKSHERKLKKYQENCDLLQRLATSLAQRPETVTVGNLDSLLQLA
jgi:adenylate/nucleoside-diphosphate kinase